jgi:hypothetical protein
MQIVYTLDDRLPPLAWVATIPPATMRLPYGTGPSSRRQSRVSLKGRGRATSAFGGRISTRWCSAAARSSLRDEACFVSSLATTDYLFYAVSEREGLRIANSLPLLLAATRDRLDPLFRGYAEVNNTIMLGVERHERVIPTRAGSVRRLMTNNLQVGRDGRPREVAKPMPPHLHDLCGVCRISPHEL